MAIYRVQRYFSDNREAASDAAIAGGLGAGAATGLGAWVYNDKKRSKITSKYKEGLKDILEGADQKEVDNLLKSKGELGKKISEASKAGKLDQIIDRIKGTTKSNKSAYREIAKELDSKSASLAEVKKALKEGAKGELRGANKKTKIAAGIAAGLAAAGVGAGIGIRSTKKSKEFSGGEEFQKEFGLGSGIKKLGRKIKKVIAGREVLAEKKAVKAEAEKLKRELEKATKMQKNGKSVEMGSRNKLKRQKAEIDRLTEAEKKRKSEISALKKNLDATREEISKAKAETKEMKDSRNSWRLATGGMAGGAGITGLGGYLLGNQD